MSLRQMFYFTFVFYFFCREFCRLRNFLQLRCLGVSFSCLFLPILRKCHWKVISFSCPPCKRNNEILKLWQLVIGWKTNLSGQFIFPRLTLPSCSLLKRLNVRSRIKALMQWNYLFGIRIITEVCQKGSVLQAHSTKHSIYTRRWNVPGSQSVRQWGWLPQYWRRRYGLRTGDVSKLIKIDTRIRDITLQGSIFDAIQNLKSLFWNSS